MIVAAGPGGRAGSGIPKKDYFVARGFAAKDSYKRISPPLVQCCSPGGFRFPLIVSSGKPRGKATITGTGRFETPGGAAPFQNLGTESSGRFM